MLPDEPPEEPLAAPPDDPDAEGDGAAALGDAAGAGDASLFADEPDSPADESDLPPSDFAPSDFAESPLPDSAFASPGFAAAGFAFLKPPSEPPLSAGLIEQVSGARGALTLWDTPSAGAFRAAYYL